MFVAGCADRHGLQQNCPVNNKMQYIINEMMTPSTYT